MPIFEQQLPFDDPNISFAPDTSGVYALIEVSEIIYYGRATGEGVTIRSRLRDHKAGRSGKCVLAATRYSYEIQSPERAEAREVQLLEEFEKRYRRLPRCNQRIG